MSHPVSIYPLSECALTVSFGNTMDVTVNNQVFALYQTLINTKKKFWIDLIPAYSSLTVCYDLATIPHQTSTAFDWVKREVEEALASINNAVFSNVRKVRIPVCYHSAYAPDIKLLCEQRKISVEELIMLHTQQSYRVYMLGFLPGFAYIGKVDARIATPRLAKPRTHVQAGSVGIAGEQTGIYPLASPGGWNIIGRTPLTLFDAHREESVLLQPGDEVSFVSISKQAFEEFKEDNTKV